MLKKILTFLVPTLISALIFYITYPPLNAKSSAFWFWIVITVLAFVISIFLDKFRRSVKDNVTNFKDFKTPSIPKKRRAAVFVCALLVASVALVLIITSSKFTNAKDYQAQLTVETGNFETDIAELQPSQIPIVDKDTAQQLGNRKIGEVVDLVSQFEVSDLYTQISFNNEPTRVSPLTYTSFFKWIKNHENGIPYYISIDMATQETTLVNLPSGMKYSPTEYFNRKLERHLRFEYPTKMFEAASFEADDSGVPYWVVPVYDFEIGAVGGHDITGAVLVDAVTGDNMYYSVADVPDWVDRVFPADLMIEQIDNWGKYKSGYWNSIFAQKGVVMATEGYNYITLEDDVWLFTGITSAASDQSNIGFLLVNLRTKETRSYAINGAQETSAMRSAEGKVQEKGYIATFPILLNVADEPTYFMSLKDAAGLVKSYAFVSVENYQIVGVGETIEQAQSEYISLLNNAPGNISGEKTTSTGQVATITTAVKSGNTYYYFTLTGDETVYIASIDISNKLPLLKVGDNIEIEYNPGDDGIGIVFSIKTVA